MSFIQVANRHTTRAAGPQVATLMPWTLLSIMEHGLTTSEHGMVNLGNGHETGAADDRRYFASKAATMVANWNAESTGYEVAYNGFAGLSQGEFRGRYLGLRQRTKEEAAVDEVSSRSQQRAALQVDVIFAGRRFVASPANMRSLPTATPAGNLFGDLCADHTTLAAP